MSAVTGWVDFQRDLHRERDTILAMTAAMACRGPDGEDVWAGRHAALGHRRLAVFDLDNGRQPVAVERDGRTVAVGAHSGSLLNHAELRRELAARGHRFRGGGDTEVLVHAYLEWGGGCAQRLEGTFAGAVWDEGAGELWLVRDRLGVEPMFYYPTRSGLLFGSEAKAILAHAQAESVVDADGLREIFTYAGTPHMAFFAGMHRLRAGHTLRFGRSGISTAAYWRVEAAEHTDGLEATIDTIRGLLEESIERNLISDVPVSTLLSGGLDSSGVAALTNRALRRRGERVRTFTLDFERHDKNFAPTDTRSTTDTPYATEVAAHLGSDHHRIVVEPGELVDPVVRHAVLRAKDFPTPLGDMNTSLYLLARGVREHARVTMTGEAADSLFHGVAWNRDPVESTMQTFPWVARGVVRDDANGLGCGLFDPGLLETLAPLDYAAQRYRESCAQAPHLPGTSAHERHMRELCWVHVSNFMENQNAHTERLFKAVGVEVRMPYCDHRIVQYAYNLPWALQNFDGREKGLLRRALSDVLPRRVLERRKTPYPVTVDPVYEAALRGEFERLLDDQSAPLRPLLDVKAARAVLADPAGVRGSWARRANLELPLQLNAWLRGYGVRLAL
ncbi:asparagine synthase (glutamine-hydrolyzing) [Dactylosporangium fulvum]|uniref:asparagine synthase (glutamine-hydrolyzing) n=1 Tax=Dactylosporangium fulvum TaxID=53359 RepID=A0ABY5W9Q1_9ACTN|nr:asparagine synthase (glutamine-hydrolyzing) [Dactylosporangium fulvum]UWP86085.1 asparagine synthase (glutamine-hydrolyzing) [Dactylosporangium fulvum]